jgi:uncharacterized protein involved in outer membrane biogenesis
MLAAKKVLKRKAVWLTVLGLVIAVLLGLRIAAGALKNQIVAALGPETEIGAISLGWFTVHVDQLRIQAPKGWPTYDTLRAERITVTPDLRSLFSDKVRISSIKVDQPYLSMRRTASGKLELLPGLLQKKPDAQKAEQKSIGVAIGEIALNDGVLDFFDATIARPPLKLRLEKVQASVSDLLVPDLMGKTKFDLDATVKGVQRDGTLELSGWVNVPTQDSSIKTTLRGVDLVALQPYLIKTNETGVKRGSIDLDLNSKVSSGKLKAPGKLTIAQLQLAPAGGTFDTFMGVPRQAVVAALKDRDDKIGVDFVLDGDIHNPQFSLNESLSMKLTYGVAQALGLSVEGLVKGVGSLGARGIGAAGSAVGKLFGIQTNDDDANKK